MTRWLISTVSLGFYSHYKVKTTIPDLKHSTMPLLRLIRDRLMTLPRVNYMNKATITGVFVSLFGLMGGISALSVGSHFPIYRWPYEAFQGIAFSLAFGLGFSDNESYAVTCVVIFLVAIIFFMLGIKLSHFLFDFK